MANQSVDNYCTVFCGFLEVHNHNIQGWKCRRKNETDSCKECKLTPKYTVPYCEDRTWEESWLKLKSDTRVSSQLSLGLNTYFPVLFWDILKNKPTTIWILRYSKSDYRMRRKGFHMVLQSGSLTISRRPPIHWKAVREGQRLAIPHHASLAS